VAKNKRISALPSRVTIDGADWYQTTSASKSGSYSWARAESSAAVDDLFKAGSPPHFTVYPSRTGNWANDIHFSDGGSRIFYFRPGGPRWSASCGWGDHLPQTSPYRRQEASLKQKFRNLLTGFGIDFDHLLDTAAAAPPPTPQKLPTVDDFPPLGGT